MCFNLKLSGDEVQYTIFLDIHSQIMLCRELHCQNVSN